MDMDTKMKKNTRERKFTTEEKLILKEIVMEEILSSKSSDWGSTSQKREAWQRIAARYNSRDDCSFRDPKKLRKFWNNLNMQYRKKKKESGETESTILSLADFSSLAELENVDAVDVNSKDSFDSDTVNTKSENASVIRKPAFICIDPHSEPYYTPENLEPCPKSNSRTPSYVPDCSYFEYVPILPTYSNFNRCTSTTTSSRLETTDVSSSAEYVSDEEKEFEELRIEDENKETVKSTKRKFTYEDLLLHKKRSIDKLDALKTKVWKAKESMFLAKAEAAKAKMAYFRIKIAQSSENNE